MKPNFLFISCKELTGADYILTTEKPYNIFKVLKFEDNNSFENYIKKYNLLNDCITIDGYNILISFVGDIENFSTVPVLGHNITEQTKKTFEPLKTFYEKERLKGNETRLKKYVRS